MIVQMALAPTLNDIAWLAEARQITPYAMRGGFSVQASAEQLRRPLRRGEAARSAPAGLLAAQRQAGAGRLCDQAAAIVGYRAFRQTYGLALLDDEAVGNEASALHRAKEIDLQFQRGERFAFFQSRTVGESHGDIGDVAEHTAVQRS